MGENTTAQLDLPQELDSVTSKDGDDNFITKLDDRFASTSTPLVAARSRPATTQKTRAAESQDSGFGETTASDHTSDTKCSQEDVPTTSSQALHSVSSINTESFSQPDSILHSSQNSCPSNQNSQDPTAERCPDSGIKLSVSSRELLPEGSLLRMIQYLENIKKRCKIDCAIGFRIGEEFVDIVSELSDKQLPCLSGILGHLDDKSLSRFEKVCKAWKAIAQKDKSSRKRLRRIRVQSTTNKENSPTKQEDPTPSSSTTSAGQPLANIQQSPSPVSSPEESNPSLFDSFTKEAEKLKYGECLTKCPRCAGPALVFREAGRGKCKRTRICEFDFCLVCELEFHGAKPCQTLGGKKPKGDGKINSQKSKQNLKRL